MTELKPILDLLPDGTANFAIKLATFIGFARILIKPIGNWIKGMLAAAAQKAIDSKETWDDHWLEVLFGFWLYRLLTFLLDLCASVKLPVLEDLKRTTPPV